MGSYSEGFQVGYDEGYTQGKAKVYREIEQRLAEVPNFTGCGCRPCQIITLIRGRREPGLFAQAWKGGRSGR